MIALLCAVALLPQQDAKVTLQVPATGLATVLKRVSDATSVPLTVDPKFAEMPLVISVKDVPLSEFLTQVGASMELDVKTNAGGFRLMRTQERQIRLESAQIAESEKYWTDSILRTRKEYEKAPWSTNLAERLIAQDEKQGEEERKMARSAESGGAGNYQDWWKNRKPGLNEHRPSARLAFRIVQAIGPKALARLPRDRPVVVSRFPTPMQVAMPQQVEQFVAQYVKESAMNPIVERPSVGDGDYPEFRGGWRGGADLTKIAGPIGKVLLTISSSRSPSATVSVFSRDGKQHDQGVFGSFVSFPEAGSNAQPEEPQHKPEKLELFQLSPLSLELVRFLPLAQDYDPDMHDPSAGEPQPEPPTISAQLAEALIHPELRDPLAYALSEALIAYASQKKLNLVARLSDESGWGYGAAEEGLDKEGRMNPEPLIHYIVHHAEVPAGAATDKQGWLVRGIPDPLQAESTFLPRAALGRYARNVVKNGPNFEAEIEFAAAIGDGDDLMSKVFYIPLFAYLQTQDIDQWMFFGSRVPFARFMGSLTPTQRAAAARDGARAAHMTQTQLARLHDLLYSKQAMMDWFGEGGAMEMMSEEDFVQPPAYFGEPTEMLPNGVPPDTTVTLRTTRREVLRSPDGDTNSAKDLAILVLIARKFPNVEGASDYIESLPKKVRVMTTISHHVRIKASKDHAVAQQFEYTRAKGSKQFQALDSPAIRAELDPWLKRFQDYSYEKLEESYMSED